MTKLLLKTFLRLFDTSFQKKRKSYVFRSEKNVKYVFSNTAGLWFIVNHSTYFSVTGLLTLTFHKVV